VGISKNREELIIINKGSNIAKDRTQLTVAGIIRDAEATTIKELIVDATVELKLCSMPAARPVLVFLIPPARKQQPNTNRMFDKMLPSMLDWTILISPFLNATMLTY
jgi:hypothetical protein